MANLIHLSQIRGGNALRSDINGLLTSYDAYKVITDIAKEGGDKYNANELLAALKTSMDNLLADVLTDGSIDQRIQAAKEGVQANIDEINNTVIKDRVKVTGTLQPDGTLAFDGDIEALVPSVDTEAHYIVYREDNKPIQDELGDALTFNFGTKVVSGVPSVKDPLDADPADGVDYVAISAPIQVKLFPIGQFKFSELKEDYLLDNNELNTVVYAQAIDQIVVDLAQDQDLIESIKTLVGTETVQNQIKTITDALATRISTLEGQVAGLLGEGGDGTSIDERIEAVRVALAESIADEEARATAAEEALAGRLDVLEGDNTVVGSVDSKIKAAADVLQGNVDTLTGTVEANRKAAHNADADLQHEIALINATKPVEDLFVTVTEGQVEFTLTAVANAKKVELEINGITYLEGDSIQVDRVTKKVTWLFTAENGGFDIQADFKVRALYETTDEVAAPVYLS